MQDETNEPWYISERAEQVALLWLTGLGVGDSEAPQAQQNIVVERCGQLIQADFGVSLTSHEKKAHFFVEVQGAMEIRRWISKQGFLLGKPLPRPGAMQPMNAPLGLLVVNVKTREAYFGWLTAPAGGASILPDDDILMQSISKALLVQIFNEVLPDFFTELV
jgi:hypothetical protein